MINNVSEFTVKLDAMLKKKIEFQSSVERLEKSLRKSFSESTGNQIEALRNQIDDTEKCINSMFGIDSSSWQDADIPVFEETVYELWVKYTVMGHCYNMYKAAIHPRNPNNPYSQWFCGYNAHLFISLTEDKHIPEKILIQHAEFIEKFKERQLLLKSLKNRDFDSLKVILGDDIDTLRFMEDSLSYLNENERNDDEINLKWAIAKFENKNYEIPIRLIQEEFSFS